MSMTYSIAFGKTLEILTKNVNDKLKEGWSLYEGVVYADGRFHQAMVMYQPADVSESSIGLKLREAFQDHAREAREEIYERTG